ncbi:MAG: hypothetical protein MUO76_14365 [Anaerolineaceae bacterium]|nr:hypothetical protein [Anaerolineaceae bacterium]
MRVIEYLLKAIRDAAMFNPEVQVAPACILWPFMSVPDVKWEKDRGKDVESAPWYHLFKGKRINDYHLNLTEKRAIQGTKEINHA